MLRRGTSSPLPPRLQQVAAATTQRRQQLDGMIHQLLARQHLLQQQAMIQGARGGAGHEWAGGTAAPIEAQQLDPMITAAAAQYRQQEGRCSSEVDAVPRKRAMEVSDDWFSKNCSSATIPKHSRPVKRQRSTSDGDSPVVSFLRKHAIKGSRQRLLRMQGDARPNDPQDVGRMTPSIKDNSDVIASSPRNKGQKLPLAEERAADHFDLPQVLPRAVAAPNSLAGSCDENFLASLASIKKMRLQQQALQLEDEALLRRLAMSRERGIISAASMERHNAPPTAYSRVVNDPSSSACVLGVSAPSDSALPPLAGGLSSYYLLGSEIRPIRAKIAAAGSWQLGGVSGHGDSRSVLSTRNHSGFLEQQQQVLAQKRLKDRRDLILQRLKLHQAASLLTAAIPRRELITGSLLRSLAAAETYNNSAASKQHQLG